MEKFIHKNILLGIKVTTFSSGSVPVTGGKEPLQLVTLKHPKKTKLVNHLHTPKKRTVKFAETCFIVKKGKIKLLLYSADKEFVTDIILRTGDIFLTFNGSGHGVEFLMGSEVAEIKNGPFIEDKILIN